LAFYQSTKKASAKSQINNAFLDFGQEHRSKSNYVEKYDSGREAGAISPSPLLKKTYGIWFK
jgi:hypothetical protein